MGDRRTAVKRKMSEAMEQNSRRRRRRRTRRTWTSGPSRASWSGAARTAQPSPAQASQGHGRPAALRSCRTSGSPGRSAGCGDRGAFSQSTNSEEISNCFNLLIGAYVLFCSVLFYFRSISFCSVPFRSRALAAISNGEGIRVLSLLLET